MKYSILGIKNSCVYLLTGCSGSYNKEDLAAALIRNLCGDLAQVIALNMQHKGIKTALLTGSLFAHPFVCDCMIEEWFGRNGMHAEVSEMKT